MRQPYQTATAFLWTETHTPSVFPSAFKTFAKIYTNVLTSCSFGVAASRPSLPIFSVGLSHYTFLRKSEAGASPYNPRGTPHPSKVYTKHRRQNKKRVFPISGTAEVMLPYTWHCSVQPLRRPDLWHLDFLVPLASLTPSIPFHCTIHLYAVRHSTTPERSGGWCASSPFFCFRRQSRELFNWSC